MKFRILSLIVLLVSNASVNANDDWTVPELTDIPPGPFIMGSTGQERDAAYRLDEAAYGHDRTRTGQWYADEPRSKPNLPAYQITTTLITNRQYLSFVKSTGYPAPDVDRKTWDGYGLVHAYPRTRRHAWQSGRYAPGRAEHPVVLVAQMDASAYAQWLSGQTGQHWRLPTEAEWEKAARGTDGRWFPWGDTYAPNKLNSHDAGPFDTMPVGSFPDGDSPYGVKDVAGQVFEWTSTQAKPGRFIVKGGSWDDKGCGVCRPSARHTRPSKVKHILIGFRLVRVTP